MAVNFKLVQQDFHDPTWSWNGRPWAGWFPAADPEDVWAYNRGVWALGDRVLDESIATFSHQGEIVLVAAITGIETVDPKYFTKGKRKRALQVYVLYPGHPVHDALFGTRVSRERAVFTYTDTAHLDQLISNPDKDTDSHDENHDATDGQGRILDPNRRKALEDAAQDRLEALYRSTGWDVEDVRFGGPFDAVARKEGQVRYLEAKGTQSNGSTVIVTSGEVNHAREHPGECVIGILSGLRFTDEGEIDDQDATFVVREWNPRDEDLQAIDYRWDSTSTPGI